MRLEIYYGDLNMAYSGAMKVQGLNWSPEDERSIWSSVRGDKKQEKRYRCYYIRHAQAIIDFVETLRHYLLLYKLLVPYIYRNAAK